MNRSGTALFGVAAFAVGAYATYYGLYAPVCTSPGRILALYCRPNYAVIGIGVCVTLAGLGIASKIAVESFSGPAG